MKSIARAEVSQYARIASNGAATSAALRAHVRLNEYPLPEG